MVSSLVSRGYIDEKMKKHIYDKRSVKIKNDGRTNRYDANRSVFTIWIRKNKNTIGRQFSLRPQGQTLALILRMWVPAAQWLVGWLVGCLVVWLFGWLVGWLVGWMVGPQKAGDVLRFTSLKLRQRLCQILRKKIQRFLPQSSENGSVKNECLTFQEW